MNEISAFFDAFSNDFKQFSGELIASRYHAPYFAVHSNSETSYLPDHAQIAKYFQLYLNDYRQQGVVSCDYECLSYIKTGECTYLAVVIWYLKDKTGKQILSWQESYSLLKQTGGLCIYSSSDFE